MTGAPAEAFLEGGGELGALIRGHDWIKTPLGLPASWPESLRSALGICLGSRFPIAIYWGERLSLLYNDAWRAIPGNKHPWALGRDAREVWPEIWDAIEPLFDQVMKRGESTYSEDSLLPMHRHGYTEECYFNFTFTPIRGASGRVDGVFNAVIETTYRVVNERRTRTLRELGERVAAATSAGEVCNAAAASLGSASADATFCAVYLAGEAGAAPALAASGGVPDGVLPAVLGPALEHAWRIHAARDTQRVQRVDELERLLGVRPPGGAWPEPGRSALVAPIITGTEAGVRGFLVLGASPRRAIDDDYRVFAERAASHIGKAIAAAAALETQRRRAEALAELDRAKTTFFSNVSHEFRTPLTLMLGPVEDMLATPAAEAMPASREALEVVQRNGQRLLKLVNTLLDFARIEAGRVQASYEPTDLAALTAELASNFRSACARAGLRLDVDCDAGHERAYVDREMWEKIVLNLVSNAFKFTLQGGIAVRLREGARGFELVVSDTGSGIAQAELPHMFERFHRVEAAKGRSFEGSGIGLALVNELVRLHGGSIEVASRLGEGSAFTVTLPKGMAHLPADRIKAPRAPTSTAARASAYVSEALSWLPQARSAAQAGPAKSGAKRVLLVDDNADLRDYAARLLGEHYDVHALADAREALAAARARVPDLVISDVMMPGLDGFGLLRELRADPRLRTVPVVLLSARAGEEARAEGLSGGADEYLVKPFSARELLVRVEALLRAADMRRQAEREVRDSEERLRVALQAGGMGAWHWDLRTSEVRWSPELEALHGLAPGTFGGNFAAYEKDIHPDDREYVKQRVGATLSGGEHHLEYRIVRPDGAVRWVEGRGRLMRDEAGQPMRVIGVCTDITARKEAEAALREAAEFNRSIIESSSDCIKVLDLDGRLLSMSQSGQQQLCIPDLAPFVGKSWIDFWQGEDRDAARAAVEAAARGERGNFVGFFRPLDGREAWWDVSVTPILGADGRPARLLSVSREVTQRKRTEDALREEARIQETLNRVGSTLAGELDLERTVQAVTDAGTQLSGAKFGAFFYNVKNAAGESYMLYTLAGAPREAFAEFGTPRKTAVFAPTFAGEGIVRVADITRDPRYGKSAPHHGMPKGHLPVRSYLAVPVVSRTGEVIGGLFFGHDQPGVFTERSERLVAGVAAQAAIAMDNARLHEQRAQLVAKLQEADRRKDEFLATLAHELRNPLAPLRNALQLLELTVRGDARIDPLREMMERQVSHLVRLVDDLLEISRISRGALELRKEPVELTAIVRNALETSEPLIKAARHRLTVSLPNGPVWLEGDAVRLAQILANLLNNAAKYTDPGGDIAVRAEVLADGVAIGVRDNGIGIEPQEMPRLFEMFSRAAGPDRAGHGGLGIGLALARRLAEMHGGTLEARSDGAGRGAEFVLRLPRAAQPAAGSGARATSTGARLPPRRILVVDDNRDAAESLGMVLNFLGADVRIARDGAEALQACESYEPSVIFLDIGMPGMDGYEVARRIRRRDGPRPAIVALTGWGQEQDRRRAREAGFDHHLVKPAELDALQAIFASLDQTAAHH